MGASERSLPARKLTPVFAFSQWAGKSTSVSYRFGRGVLVNGVPSLSFAVLMTRDSVLLRPGCMAYVTTRVNPFVGRPSDELLGKKCRFCSIAIEESTRVVVCACGQPFHHETPQSHPEIPSEEERLACFDKVKKCLTCGKDLALARIMQEI